MIRLLPFVLAACTPQIQADTGNQPDIGSACISYQYIELFPETGTLTPLLIDLGNAMREQTPRVEACVQSAAWLCEPCDVMIYATDPILEPYPEGGQAVVDGCTREPVVTYRVTHILCGEG